MTRRLLQFNHLKLDHLLANTKFDARIEPRKHSEAHLLDVRYTVHPRPRSDHLQNVGPALGFPASDIEFAETWEENMLGSSGKSTWEHPIAITQAWGDTASQAHNRALLVLGVLAETSRRA